LFAITVDNAELNAVMQTPKQVVVNVGNITAPVLKPEEELRPVIAGEGPHGKANIFTSV
jgi:hypothetical protein